MALAKRTARCVHGADDVSPVAYGYGTKDGKVRAQCWWYISSDSSLWYRFKIALISLWYLQWLIALALETPNLVGGGLGAKVTTSIFGHKERQRVWAHLLPLLGLVMSVYLCCNECLCWRRHEASVVAVKICRHLQTYPLEALVMSGFGSYVMPGVNMKWCFTAL